MNPYVILSVWTAAGAGLTFWHPVVGGLILGNAAFCWFLILAPSDWF